MSSTYTKENYSPDVLPAGLRKDVRALIQEAVDANWSVHVKHIRATIAAPPPHDKDQTFTFSASASAGNFNPDGIKRKIKKYGAAPAKKAAAKQQTDAELERIATEKREAALRKEAEVKGEVKLAGERAVENKEATNKKDPNPTIESIEPLMVSREHRTVASDSTLVRTWSSGKVDYLCAVPGCDFVSDNQYGPSRGHRRRHTLSGEVEADRRSQRTRTSETLTTVRSEASAVLAAALKTTFNEGVNWSDLDAACTAIAERATALMPKPEAPKEEAPAKPSEAEVLLEQIKELLGAGENAKQRDEIASLREQMAALETKASEALSERDRLLSERTALRELLTDDKKQAAS